MLHSTVKLLQDPFNAACKHARAIKAVLPEKLSVFLGELPRLGQRRKRLAFETSAGSTGLYGKTSAAGFPPGPSYPPRTKTKYA
jgi:hypothetical protein